MLFIIRVSLHLICQHRSSADAGTSGGSHLGGGVRVVCHPRSFHHTWALMERPTFLFPSLSIKPSASAHGVSSYIYIYIYHERPCIFSGLSRKIICQDSFMKWSNQKGFFLPWTHSNQVCRKVQKFTVWSRRQQRTAGRLNPRRTTQANLDSLTHTWTQRQFFH